MHQQESLLCWSTKTFSESKSGKLRCNFQDGEATAMQTKVNDFKMYYAMQMYFANGGGLAISYL
ncbi:hypothetical protein EJ377_01990 [Chryseobacterium arthrosphaerae]|uniref:Uncharacterized protein n=1 Tax=Chryseobacterium arthrosphaerae TaxID=651561 RepID=A0A432DYR8_9FLAO|nr:hypothetical protein EJ377_01990 [Chryseobacterium arthrosphaerae]